MLVYHHIYQHSVVIETWRQPAAHEPFYQEDFVGLTIIISIKIHFLSMWLNQGCLLSFTGCWIGSSQNHQVQRLLLLFMENTCNMSVFGLVRCPSRCPVYYMMIFHGIHSETSPPSFSFGAVEIRKVFKLTSPSSASQTLRFQETVWPSSACFWARQDWGRPGQHNGGSLLPTPGAPN